MRPLSSCRPGSALQKRPMSGQRLGSASSGIAANLPRPNTDPLNDISNDASELTIGPTLYGNPLRGLMARRKGKPETAEPNLSPTSLNAKQKTHKQKESTNTNENDTELFKELKSWRTEHER